MSLENRVLQLERFVAELVRQKEELERRVHNLMRPGRVTEVDPKQGMVRVAYAVDEQGQDVISPLIPWTERAGAIKTWTPPAVGEQVLLFSPSGDVSTHSWVLTGGFSDQFKQPHDKGAEHVMTVGSTRITVKGDEMRINSPKIVFEGETHLGGEGGQLVHRKGDKDSDGDVAVESATKVYAV